jgi:hypothetical protein
MVIVLRDVRFWVSLELTPRPLWLPALPAFMSITVPS